MSQPRLLPPPRHRMSPRQQFLFVGTGAIAISMIALVVGILGTYPEAEARIEAPSDLGPDPVQILSHTVVLAPVEPLRRGTKLSDVNLKEIEWPRNQVPEGALRRGEVSESAYARADLPAGVPVTRDQVSPTPNSIAVLIKPGFRAATLEVDSTSGVEGWASAGTHVDVVLTYRDPADNKKKSQIVIENAVVLSYDRHTEKIAPVAPALPEPGNLTRPLEIRVTTATLLVPVRDAVKLHAARALGVISLVLRSTGDERLLGPVQVTPDDFRGRVS